MQAQLEEVRQRLQPTYRQCRPPMRKQLPCPPMLQHPCLERALAQGQRRRTPIRQAAPRAMRLQTEVCTNHPDANPSDTVMLPQVACASSLSPQTAPSDTLTARNAVQGRFLQPAAVLARLAYSLQTQHGSSMSSMPLVLQA